MTADLLLIDPKHPRNVGMILRGASSFGVDRLRWTGNRVVLEGEGRLPREERMRGYRDVDYGRVSEGRCFEGWGEGVVPVAVEVNPSAEQLPDFVHPERALYVLGPEDGGLRSVHLRHCHRVVMIPTRHCLNLAVAAQIVLYDRQVKRRAEGLEEVVPTWQVLAEDRQYEGFGLR